MAWKRFLKHRLALVSALILLVISVAVIFAGSLSKHDPYTMNFMRQLEGPSRDHPLGTDEFGRDLLARLLHGGRVSLAVAFGAMAFSVVVGVVLGMVAGYAGGWVDTILMRAMDVVLAFPIIMVAMVVIAALGSNPAYIAIVIGIVRAPAFARVVRSVVLEVREKEFVEAAKALGKSHFGILATHVLPNVLPSVVVLVSLYTAGAITTESSLSFLGLGTQPPNPSWGAIAAEGREYLSSAPHVTTFAGLAVFVVVWALNLVGDALRDALDPKSK